MFKSFDEWFNSKLSAFGEWQWTDTMVDAYLISDHPDIALERAKDFFVTIDAPMLREGNIIKLFEAGFDTPTKIIQMTKKEMVNVLGENGKKAFDGLKAKLNPIPLYVLMAASGAFGRGVGVRKMKKLYEAAKGDVAKFNDVNFICNVEGFEEKTARRIIEGKEQWNKFFTDVMENVTLEQFIEKEAVDGELTGQFVVFTGFRNSDLEMQIVERGGVMQTGVSKKTTLVIAADPEENSTKLKKARELGIRIISMNEIELLF